LSRSTRGIATYLQTMILLGVAVGGALLVSQSLGSYTSQGQAGIALTDVELHQGASFAIEAMTVTNTGTSPVQSLTILNPGALSSAGYCYSLWSPPGGSLVSSSCPAMTTNPQVIPLNSPISPGSSVAIQVLMSGGGVFSAGSTFSLTVQSNSGALASLKLEAVPA